MHFSPLSIALPLPSEPRKFGVPEFWGGRQVWGREGGTLNYPKYQEITGSPVPMGSRSFVPRMPKSCVEQKGKSSFDFDFQYEYKL